MVDIVERLRLDAEPTEGDMEDAADEIERLREVLRETIKVMALAHDRIHVLPRTTDTELARSIELSIKHARAALRKDK